MRTPAPGTYEPTDDVDVDVDLDWERPAPDQPAPASSGTVPAARSAPTSTGPSGPLSTAPNRPIPERRPPAMLRLPGIDDPAPHGSRLLGMCAWATTLGLIGLAVAVRAFVLIVGGSAVWWFQPAVVSTGLVGIGLAAAAFMAVHRRRLPWLMLTAATAMLLLAITLTSSI